MGCRYSEPFCPSLQQPPWQRLWWQHLSSGACARPSRIIRKMASTVCGSTATSTMMRFDSTPWDPRSRCSPTSFRTRVKVKRIRCMQTKSNTCCTTFPAGAIIYFDDLLYRFGQEQMGLSLYLRLTGFFHLWMTASGEQWLGKGDYVALANSLNKPLIFSLAQSPDDITHFFIFLSKLGNVSQQIIDTFKCLSLLQTRSICALASIQFWVHPGCCVWW